MSKKTLSETPIASIMIVLKPKFHTKMKSTHKALIMRTKTRRKRTKRNTMKVTATKMKKFRVITPMREAFSTKGLKNEMERQTRD